MAVLDVYSLLASRWLGAVACAALVAVRAPAAAEVPIAGERPDARPEGAPRVEAVVRDGQWYRRALTGVSTPYPSSLRFLESQGNWYTPFDQPGMTGWYDIRRWHRNERAMPANRAKSQ